MSIQTFIVSKQLPTPLWMFPWKFGTNIQATGNTTGVNGDVYLAAFYTPFPITITRFDLNLAVLGGAGTFLRLGLYGNGGTPTSPKPDTGTLLWDSGNLVADANGNKDVAVTPNVVINGWFYGCLETNDATVQFGRSLGTAFWTEQGTEKLIGWKFNQAFGALPSTCPTTSSSLTSNIACALRYT